MRSSAVGPVNGRRVCASPERQEGGEYAEAPIPCQVHLAIPSRRRLTHPVAGVCDPGRPRRGRLEKAGLAEAGYRRKARLGPSAAALVHLRSFAGPTGTTSLIFPYWAAAPAV